MLLLFLGVVGGRVAGGGVPNVLCAPYIAPPSAAAIVPQNEMKSLTEFVELPPQYSGLLYSNLLCGVIRGALEMVRILRWLAAVTGVGSGNGKGIGNRNGNCNGNGNCTGNGNGTDTGSGSGDW